MRSLFDWEKDQELELIMQMERKTINEENEDKCDWKGSDSIRFTVQSAYKVLKSEVQGEDSGMYGRF